MNMPQTNIPNPKYSKKNKIIMNIFVDNKILYKNNLEYKVFNFYVKDLKFLFK